MAKKISIEEIVGWWLEKYHGITYQEAKREYEKDKEKGGEPVFFERYKVTQEQYDEWEKWFYRYLSKKSGMPIAYVKRHSWAIYLDVAPMVKTDSEMNNKEKAETIVNDIIRIVNEEPTKMGITHGYTPQQQRN